MVLKISSARLPTVENSRSKKISITEQKNQISGEILGIFVPQ